MMRSVYKSLFVILVTIHVTVQLECGYNEVLIECPADCPSDYCPTTPTSKHSDPTCPNPQVCGKPECKCRFNTRRASNGTCIDTVKCPPFPCSGPNEEYVACPPYCPSDNCSQATRDGRCPYLGFILIVVECNPQCRCIKDYWRNNGVCVPYDQCSQTESVVQ